jgi:hypothetical protein
MDGRATISDIFTLYDEALKQTRERFDESVKTTTKNLELFYPEFLNKHVICYANLFENEGYRSEIHRELQQRHRTSSLRFWAVDGACKTVETSDLSVFYGGAYVVKGELDLQDNPPLISYKESEPEDDSSVVAYLPLSSEDLTIIDPEDRFVVNDSELISTSGLDTALMLLAEIYLLYRGASQTDHPHLLIWDHSLSSVLANATPNVRKLRFSGIEIGGENIWYPDLLVGYSKPWNEKLDVPTRKSHRLWERVIAKLYTSPSKSINITEFSQDVGMEKKDVETQIRLIWECDKHGKKWDGKNPETALVMKDGEKLTLNENYKYSHEKIKRLYEHFCNRFFREKDPSVLLYNYIDEKNNRRQRYLTSDEISFLMAIGLRLTFENCWKNGVLLVGVVKDSASAYFTNHYLGVMKNIGEMSFVPRIIPGTDRFTFERLPYIDDNLEGPWSSTEFDGVFMTLRMRKDWESEQPTIQGVRGDVLVQPNLVMRSLVQFYLKNEPSRELLMGHVIFVDRLVQPSSIPPIVQIMEGDKNLGTVQPFYFRDSSVRNKEQEIVIYLLSVLTRNVFPEVIGYPDPLHHADRGAKSVLNMVYPMLISSERINRINPMYRTLRQNRGG